jgi:hypothetical protein
VCDVPRLGEKSQADSVGFFGLRHPDAALDGAKKVQSGIGMPQSKWEPL